MNIDTIVLHDDADYSLEFQMDNKLYILEFQWNERGEYWILNIYNTLKEPLVLGIVLTPLIDLLAPYKNSDLPSGYLFCYDKLNHNLYPTKESVLDSFVLVYMYE